VSGCGFPGKFLHWWGNNRLPGHVRLGDVGSEDVELCRGVLDRGGLRMALIGPAVGGAGRPGNLARNLVGLSIALE
jgi:hypothetical protein